MDGWLSIRTLIKLKKRFGSIGKRLWKNYIYSWAVKVEMACCLNYEEAVNSLRYVCGDRFIEESCGFVIMKAGTKYLVLDITALCESCRGSFGSDNLYSLYDLLEGKF